MAPRKTGMIWLGPPPRLETAAMISGNLNTSDSTATVAPEATSSSSERLRRNQLVNWDEDAGAAGGPEDDGAPPAGSSAAATSRWWRVRSRGLRRGSEPGSIMAVRTRDRADAGAATGSGEARATASVAAHASSCDIGGRDTRRSPTGDGFSRRGVASLPQN
eukprot:scaffold344_cov113-Isochrysis_galbana.AAC.1